MRVSVLIAAWLCALTLTVAPPARAQDQPPAPAAQSGSDDQSPPSAKPPVNPKTDLPLTPEEQREKQIDKYDPFKPTTDSTNPNANAPTDRQAPTAVDNPGAQAAPLPGSVAASEQEGAAGQTGTQSGQDFTGGSDADAAYSGPAVLTRSYTLSRPMLPADLKWRPVLGFTYAWDDGEVPGVVVNSNPYATVTAWSRAVNWALTGRHIWKHDQLGVNYGGNYSSYSAGGLSGMNNTLGVDYSHVVSRRLSFNFVESLSDLSQNYTLGNPALQPGSSVASTDLAATPNIQLLNTTVRQASSSVSMTFQQSKRVSYNISASYFLTGQSGVGVVGVTGKQTGADINYRWTRKATVGTYYSYTNYLYSHHVSQADSSSAGVIYSYALNPHTQLRTRIGATRIESLAYETLQLSPVLAAILGQAAALVNAYSLNWSSDISAELVRDFSRSRTASLAFARGESPGNGVLLASVQETASAGYTMSLFRRRIPVSAGAVYSKLSSIAQNQLGSYSSETAYLGISRALTKRVSGSLRIDYRRYLIQGSPLLEHDLRISLGLSWSPEENSLRF